jgi:hypothetical protein
MLSKHRKFQISTFTAALLLLAASGTLHAQSGSWPAPGSPISDRDLLSSGSYRIPVTVPSPIEPAPPDHPIFGPPPRVGPNLRVNAPQPSYPDGLLGRSETTLAALAGGRLLVAAWNDADGFCGPPYNAPCPAPPTPGITGYGISTDGGRHFRDLGAPPAGTRVGFGPGAAGTSASGVYVSNFDPILDAAGPGARDAVYLSSLADFDDLAEHTAGVAVYAGHFGPGGSFAFEPPVLLQSPGYPGDFLDKDNLAAVRHGHETRLYVTATDFIQVAGVPGLGRGQIELYGSDDGGASWSRHVLQPDETFPGQPGAGVINQGAEPVVSPDGSIHVAWERGFLSPFFSQGIAGQWPEIRVISSFDGGTTWTPAAAGPPGSGVNPAGVRVASICAGDLFPPSGYDRNRTNSFPRIAVAESGPHRGRLYVVWQDCRIANGGPMPAPLGPEDDFGYDLGHPDTDVYLAYSDDDGATWSAPILAAGGGDGLIQFWPTVSAGPGGTVDLTYYESYEPDGTVLFGGGPGTSLVDVSWVRSTDGGRTFGPPVRLTDVTTDWAVARANSNLMPTFGDYNDALTVGNRLLATWGDGRIGYPEVLFAVAFAGH